MRQTKESLSEATASAWLHLLKKTLIRYPLDDADREMTRELHGVSPALRQEIERWIEHNQQGKLQESGDVEARASGRDWPATAETMIGLFRMDSLHSCLLDLLHRKVPGDLAEVGVWRGGAGIMMRAVLKAFGEKRRKVWLADSFQGFPPPDAKRYPMDAADIHATHPELAVLQETVKQNFKRYGLWMSKCAFSRVGFATRCRQRPSSRSRSCTLIAICMNLQPWPCIVCILNSRPADTSLLTTTAPFPVAGRRSQIFGTSSRSPRRYGTLTGQESSGRFLLALSRRKRPVQKGNCTEERSGYAPCNLTR